MSLGTIEDFEASFYYGPTILFIHILLKNIIRKWKLLKFLNLAAIYNFFGIRRINDSFYEGNFLFFSKIKSW